MNSESFHNHPEKYHTLFTAGETEAGRGCKFPGPRPHSQQPGWGDLTPPPATCRDMGAALPFPYPPSPSPTLPSCEALSFWGVSPLGQATAPPSLPALSPKPSSGL